LGKGRCRWFEYIASAGLNVMRLVGMGVFHGGTLSYQMFTWFDGEDLAEALPRMSNQEQYAAGVKCGGASRILHSLPPLNDAEPWGLRYKRKVQDKIQSLNDKHIKSREVEVLLRYLQDNMNLPDNRPHTTTHGDWNTENIILCPGGQIGIIDRGADCNDPWWEFWEISDDADLKAHFYTGQIKGYFEGEPPDEYFPLLAYYTAFGRLEWGYNCKCVLSWFDDMRYPVPSWYLKDYNAL
jgi:serine/threonine-protein kinase